MVNEGVLDLGLGSDTCLRVFLLFQLPELLVLVLLLEPLRVASQRKLAVILDLDVGGAHLAVRATEAEREAVTLLLIGVLFRAKRRLLLQCRCLW